MSSDKRAPQLPDVPTTAEIGYPAAAYAFWNGLFVPVKTPQDIVTKLYQEIQKTIADPGVKEKLDKVGVAAAGDVAAGVPEILRGRRDGHRQARQGRGHREAVNKITRHTGGMT